MLLVFLTLAAQYESWSLPLAIILIVPMCLLSAMAACGCAHGQQHLHADRPRGAGRPRGKNAILIVEFAKQLEDQGKGIARCRRGGRRLRLRPILMTSFAFILGVLPLVIAEGAGAEMRQALGTAVFSGMIGVTFFGLFLTPVFYVVIRKLTKGAAPESS